VTSKKSFLLWGDRWFESPLLQRGDIPATIRNSTEGISGGGALASFTGASKKTRFLAYFDDKFPIERALTRALLHHKKTGKYPEVDTLTNTGFYELYSFAKRLSPAARHRIRTLTGPSKRFCNQW
jgi:hypothetical protein